MSCPEENDATPICFTRCRRNETRPELMAQLNKQEKKVLEGSIATTTAAAAATALKRSPVFILMQQTGSRA